MAELSVLNATCDCATDGSCDCDLSELHFACTRNKTLVHAELPETGEVGTTYLIGTNETGYVEYVWLGSSWQRMGDAAGSFINDATATKKGVVKLSTNNVLTEGGLIGANSEKQIMVRVATRTIPGVVKLGSDYFHSNGQAYVGGKLFAFIVGIGVTSTSKELAFNLAIFQPDILDGMPESERKYEFGPLRYSQVYRRNAQGQLLNAEGAIVESEADAVKEWQMHVMTASPSQLGVVKLLHSLNGYTDEEIKNMRNTHAASVALVLDGLESFCWDFFTDTRIKGYFDLWATGKDLAQQIWEDAAKREALFENVVDVVLGDANFKLQIDTIAKKWLTDKFTDAFVVGLFQNDILTKTKEISDAHWNDDLEATIQSTVEEEVEKQLPDAMAEFIANPDNVEIVAESVKEKVQESVSEDASTEALNYAKNVFNSSQEIEIGGVKTTFAAYFNAQIDKHVEAIKASLNASVAVALNRSYTTEELFVAQPQKTEYNVELKSVSGYDVLVVDYLANGGEEASLCIDLNIARAASPRPLCVAAGGVNGANIDTKYGSNDVTPCVKLDLASNTLTWWYYGPYGSRSGIKRVCGLKGARLP